MPDGAEPEYVARVRAELQEQRELLPPDRVVSSAFYVFFSFDLVNSTLYKTLSGSRWPLVITKFYEFVEDGLKKHIPRVHLWKYVGDELLLYKRIESLDDLRGCVPKAHVVMKQTIQKLHDLFRDTRTVLSVKTTVWCAHAHDVPPADIQTIEKRPAPTYRNLVLSQSSGPGQDRLDFLGPDIDIGFRIAKFAARRRLVVSADLAYLLYRDRAENEGIENRLRIVAYEQLKGVWGGRQYPVLWYENDWTGIASSFLYDEHHHNDIIQRLKSGRDAERLGTLTKVLEDLDLREASDELWTYVSALTPVAGDEEAAELVQGSASGLLEVHCVAVCFRQDGRAPVGRRSADKRRFPGYWEFGCGQLAPFESFEECLRRAYQEDFGAELVFHGPAIPVATYTIEDADEDRQIPGIIFAVGIANPEDVAARKHDAIDWVNPDAPDMQGAGCVPNYADTLKQAVEVWRKKLRRAW